MANTQKKDIVASLISALENHQNFAVVEFDQISHKTFENIRRELKKVGASLKVIKNSLLEKAVNKLSQTDAIYTDIRKKGFPIKKNSAVLTFTGDWDAGLKKYQEFTKDFPTLLYKLGLIDKTVYDKEGLSKLALLPGKSVLLASLIGSLKQPMTRTTRALSSPMQKLAYVLNQRSQQSN